MKTSPHENPDRFKLPDAKAIVAMIRMRLTSPLFLKKTIERLLEDKGIENKDFHARAVWEKCVEDLIACANAYLEPLSAVVNYADPLFQSHMLVGTWKK